MKLNYNATGTTRKEMVAAIAAATDEKVKYMGMPTAAYQVGGFTVTKAGELVWDEAMVIDTLGKVTAALAGAGFYPENAENADLPAASAEDEEETAEPETEDAEASSPEDADGLTISLPRDGFSESALDNLNRMVEAKGNLIKKALGAKSLEIAVDEDKVSFPWFDRIPDPDETQAYMTFITALCKMAKEAKRVTAKEKPLDDGSEKYAFRCYLLRLGFIGAEYKTARKILMKNLSGNSSWKNGRPEEVEA